MADEIGGAPDPALAAEARRIAALLAAADVRAAVDDRAAAAAVKFRSLERRGVPVWIKVAADASSPGKVKCVLCARDDEGDEGEEVPNSSQREVPADDGEGLVRAVRDLVEEPVYTMATCAAGALVEEVVDVSTYLELQVCVVLAGVVFGVLFAGFWCW
jgi:hypothetical protein